LETETNVKFVVNSGEADEKNSKSWKDFINFFIGMEMVPGSGGKGRKKL